MLIFERIGKQERFQFRNIQYLDKKGESYVFIPGGLTRYLQPLDIGVNKQFKEHLKDNYLSDLAMNIDENNEDKEGELKKYENIFGDGKKAQCPRYP